MLRLELTSAGSCSPESDGDLSEVHYSVSLEIDPPQVFKRGLHLALEVSAALVEFGRNLWNIKGVKKQAPTTERNRAGFPVSFSWQPTEKPTMYKKSGF